MSIQCGRDGGKWKEMMEVKAKHRRLGYLRRQTSGGAESAGGESGLQWPTRQGCRGQYWPGSFLQHRTNRPRCTYSYNKSRYVWPSNSFLYHSFSTVGAMTILHCNLAIYPMYRHHRVASTDTEQATYILMCHLHVKVPALTHWQSGVRQFQIVGTVMQSATTQNSLALARRRQCNAPPRRTDIRTRIKLVSADTGQPVFDAYLRLGDDSATS